MQTQVGLGFRGHFWTGQKPPGYKCLSSERYAGGWLVPLMADDDQRFIEVPLKSLFHCRWEWSSSMNIHEHPWTGTDIFLVMNRLSNLKIRRTQIPIWNWPMTPSAKKDGDTLNNELDDENDAEGAPGESWWLPKGTKDGTKHQPGRWMDMHFTTHDHDLDERHLFFFNYLHGQL